MPNVIAEVGIGVKNTDAEMRDAVLSDATKFKGADVGAIKTQTDKITAVKTETDKIPATITKIDGIKTETDKISSVKTETDKIAGVKTQTDKIPATITKIDGIKAETDKISATITKIDGIKTETDKISAIKTQTDEVPSIIDKLDSIKADTEEIPDCITDYERNPTSDTDGYVSLSAGTSKTETFDSSVTRVDIFSKDNEIYVAFSVNGSTFKDNVLLCGDMSQTYSVDMTCLAIRFTNVNTDGSHDGRYQVVGWR
jgi:hypothetical protein